MIHHITNQPQWGPRHPETFARYVTRATCTAFATAMLFVGTANATLSDPADTGPEPTPHPMVKVADFKQFAEFVTPQGKATLSVLPATRWHGPEGVNHARVVVFALLNDKPTKGYALFTEFKCDEHTYAIPTLMTISVTDGVVDFEQVVETGPRTQSFTPTNEGKDAWGPIAEDYACTGVMPKFMPGTQS